MSKGLEPGWLSRSILVFTRHSLYNSLFYFDYVKKYFKVKSKTISNLCQSHYWFAHVHNLSPQVKSQSPKKFFLNNHHTNYFFYKFHKYKIDRLYPSLFLLHLHARHASASARISVGPTVDAVLHISSSQKHMWPVPELSIMHTWSTMKRFIWSWEVHVRRTTSYAGKKYIKIYVRIILFHLQGLISISEPLTHEWSQLDELYIAKKNYDDLRG